MQQAENQHLDFLISQYVDGTLEGSGKKSVEHKMLLDPDARALYAEHRETQDVLDDWGNRLPMIDWNAFDSKLAAKLDEEATEQERVSIFRRRMKPVAAAAALLIAASLGYGWHALSHATVGNITTGPGEIASVTPTSKKPTATLLDGTGTKPSKVGLSVYEPAASALNSTMASSVTVSIPEDSTALASLQDSLQNGLKNVADVAATQSVPSAVVVDQYTGQKDEKDQQLPR